MLLPALPALIACVDSSEDVVLLLRDRMVDAGYRAVTYISPIRYGCQPVVDFLTYLAPDAAIYNVAPPYRESWAEFQYVLREVPECPCLAATTNKAALELVVGATDTLEVLATPADLDVLAEAVRALLAGQPVAARSPDGVSGAIRAWHRDAEAPEASA